MGKKKKGLKQRLKPRQKKKVCFFCQEGQKPDYKEPEVLRRFTTERGKIVGRGRTGVCRKHQKKLSQEIKRARILALLPFVVKIR